MNFKISDKNNKKRKWKNSYNELGSKNNLYENEENSSNSPQKKKNNSGLYTNFFINKILYHHQILI